MTNEITVTRSEGIIKRLKTILKFLDGAVAWKVSHDDPMAAHQTFEALRIENPLDPDETFVVYEDPEPSDYNPEGSAVKVAVVHASFPGLPPRPAEQS